MRIVVSIKQVPGTDNVKMDPETGTMVREGVESVINPLDLYAIELGISLREQVGGEVIVMSMGPAPAAEALREAVAMGCDSAVLLCDRAFAGADTWSTSYVLQAAIEKIGEVDLVICGERATDGETGQVGPGIAAFLNWPVASYVSHLDEVADDKVVVQRMVEGGWQKVGVELPAVLTVVKDVANPRLPTLRGKQRARALDLPTWLAADLTVETEKLGLKGSPTRVVKIDRPKVTRQCQRFAATDEPTTTEAVDAVIALLQERQLV
jgi:electron transfer flavoprotein beta subunit